MYLKKSIVNYSELLSDEKEIEFLLLEKDIEGRDSLEIASQLHFYELFQDRNVQEVIMAIWKGRYSIEGSFLEVSSSI